MNLTAPRNIGPVSQQKPQRSGINHAVLVLCQALILMPGCGQQSETPEQRSQKTQVSETHADAAATTPAETMESESNMESPEIRFVEIAATAGIDFEYRNGEEQGTFTILESLGGGVGATDIDSDGLVDLFLPGGGSMSADANPTPLPSVIYRNSPGTLNSRFQSVAKLTNAEECPCYSHGALAADWNDDGFEDILVTGYGQPQLLWNMGDGTYAAGPAPEEDSWISSAAAADFNSDGVTDLYLARYVDWSPSNNPACDTGRADEREVCPPRQFAGMHDIVLLGDGTGKFERTKGPEFAGKGLGVVVADLDLDGDCDVYVANDTVRNIYLVNDGKGTFKDRAESTGTAYGDTGREDGSMGVDAGDYNLDGRPDILVTNYELEDFALYRSFNEEFFQHVSRSTGISAACGHKVGWGTQFADVDLDGDEDLFTANGHVIRHPKDAPLKQTALLMINHQATRFEQTNAGPFFQEPHMSRGAIQCDLENDGDCDFVISCINEPLCVLRNDTQTNHNWLRLRLVGKTSNRIPAGAVITLITSDGLKLLRLQKSGTSFASSADNRLAWGLGDATGEVTLQIRWPSGVSQTIEGIQPNRIVTVIEGRDTAWVVDGTASTMTSNARG